MHSLAVRELVGKGRGVVAARPIADGERLLECCPMAAVLKSGGGNSSQQHCVECLQPSPRSPFCSSACEDAYAARGGKLLERVDLSALHTLKVEQDRKFPLLIASLLASLLAELKATGRLPEPWLPLELCYAELHAEADAQTEEEHSQLLRAFAQAGLANSQTLELFLPLRRYRRLLGAAQLNAFELSLSHGARVSALLPGVASMFNHSCEPNVLISCAESTRVGFVAHGDVAEGDELCISYVALDDSAKERKHLLLHKYAFDCMCPRCQRGE